LAKLARHPKVVGWGEIGLDYFYDHSPRDIQEQVFRQQMELAHAAKLPIIIHCRDAWPDCLRLLEEAWKPTGLGGVLHCFTSTLEDAKVLPLQNILIETDSPYLAPQSHRGKRNEPAYVAEVAQVLANVRNLPVEEVAQTTAGNFRRFFPLTRSGTAPAAVPR